MSAFDIAEFARPHPPRAIGSLVSYRSMFSCEHFALRLLDLPIRLGQRHADIPSGCFELPEYAERFRPFVTVCDAAMGERIDGRYAYLTVDQGLVKAGTTQRTAGCHVDGFQGGRVQPKVETDISFVVSDVLPTLFYPEMTFRLGGMDPAIDNFFHEFDRQLDDRDNVAAWSPAPYEIVECSAYTVHEAAPARHDLVRTFLRLTYSVRQFDRLGNSVNPRFGRLWQYNTRETPQELSATARHLLHSERANACPTSPPPSPMTCTPA